MTYFNNCLCDISFWVRKTNVSLSETFLVRPQNFCLIKKLLIIIIFRVIYICVYLPIIRNKTSSRDSTVYLTGTLSLNTLIYYECTAS